MATQLLVDNFRGKCEECTQINIETLLNNADWGSISFEGCRPELERSYGMLNHFKLLPVELLPDAQVEKITQKMVQLLTTITSISNFKIEVSNPAGTRDGLLNQFKNDANEFYMEAHLYIPFLAYQKGDVQRNISELTASVTKASGLLESTKTDIAKRESEIGTIISAARDAAASVGVAHFSADFKAESEAQEESAKTWLMVTGAAAVATLLTAVAIIFIPINADATMPQVLQLFTSKVVILGLLFTATIWCGRLYKAAKHQGLTNKHRANALRTFQAFTKATSEDSVRDAVLFEATKSIFAISQSGYLENESVPENSSKIVEVIRNASQAVAATKT